MKKQVIKLTEGDLHRIIKESVKKIIKEMNGGGATNCANALQTGAGKSELGTNPEAGEYSTAVPFGADSETADRHPGFSVDGKSDVQRRPMYNPKSGKKKVRESMYDDEWAEYDDEADFLKDKYSDDYGREDPTYQMQKNDYKGIISMLKQYGYNAEIEDNDPEGEFPPTLTIIEDPRRKRRFTINDVIKFLKSRGWELNQQYSGERTEKGILYMFRPPFTKFDAEYDDWKNQKY